MTREAEIVPIPEYRLVYRGQVLGLYTTAREVLRALPADALRLGYSVVALFIGTDGCYVEENGTPRRMVVLA